MTGYNIAIDFGNSNIKVATMDKGKIRIFPFNNHGSNEGYIQNKVFYTKDEFFLGKIAEIKASIAKNEDEIIYEIKQKLESKDWKIFIPSLNIEKTSIDVVGDILNELRKKIKEKNGNREIDNCIITIPVNFSELQKEKIKKACKNINLPLVALISEPIAGGLRMLEAEIKDLDDDEEKNVIVFDCGGGTLDIALLNFSKYDDNLTFRVLDSIGTNYGGIYINELIFEKCFLPKIENSSFLNEKKYKSKILSEIEKAKISCLGSEEEEEYEIILQDSEYDFKIQSTCIVISKEEMEDVIFKSNLENTIKDMFDYLLENEGFEKEDISKVVIMGGTSKILCIQNMIKDYFDDEDIFDIEDLDDEEIYYSVPKGAAIYLQNLLEKNSNLTIENKNPYQLIGKQKNGREVIILTKDTSFETETPPKRFKTISNNEEEKEAFLYQKFKTFGRDKNLKIAIGKVKCNKSNFTDYIYYRFSVDKYGEIKCKFYNNEDFTEESNIILED